MFGIIVRMFMEAGAAHHTPHFHACYQEHVGVFSLDPVDAARDRYDIPSYERAFTLLAAAATGDPILQSARAWAFWSWGARHGPSCIRSGDDLKGLDQSSLALSIHANALVQIERRPWILIVNYKLPMNAGLARLVGSASSCAVGAASGEHLLVTRVEVKIEGTHGREPACSRLIPGRRRGSEVPNRPSLPRKLRRQ